MYQRSLEHGIGATPQVAKMKLDDFPKTKEKLKSVQPQIELIRLESSAGVSAINAVREELHLPSITVEDLLFVVLARLEAQLTKTS
mgnify:FL=1